MTIAVLESERTVERMTKEEAIKRIREHQIIHQTKEPRAIFITEALDMAIEALNAEPKHGRWIDEKCSVCNYGVESWNVGTNYCPNCGADMRGEQNE